MNKLQFKISLFGGIIISITIIIVQTLQYHEIISDPDWILFIISLIFCIGLIYTTIFYRRKRVENTLTYGESLGTSLIITVIAALFVSCYAFIFRKFIDPFDTGELLSSYNQGTNSLDTQISEQNDKFFDEFLNFIYKPINAFLLTFLGYFFGGLFISLISAVFIKKSIKTTSANNT